MSSVLSSTAALISTISENVTGDYDQGPPEYSESLAVNDQFRVVDNNNNNTRCSLNKSDNPPSYDYLYDRPSYYATVTCGFCKQLLRKGKNGIYLIFTKDMSNFDFYVEKVVSILKKLHKSGD